MTDEYDVVVIGGGPVGENAAQYATEGTDLGAVLVEGELFGGECSYWACMPSKALLRPISVAGTTHDLPGVHPTEVDRDALLARRDAWVSSYDDAGQVRWAHDTGIATVRGHGRLVGDRLVEVTGPEGTRRLRSRHAVVIATGSAPAVPAPFVDVRPWGSRDATGVVEVPDRLVVIGGGVVACEAATWMSAIGSQVTMLVRGERLLSGLEPFVGREIADSLRAKGVDVRLSTSSTGCTRPDPQDTGVGRVHGGPVTVETDDGAVEADEVLVATGRRPRLDDVGLETVDLTADDVLEGRLPGWLHAVGDASGDAPLTHWGKYRARVVGAQIAASATGAPAPAVVEDAPVPQVVFTDPQVASVGMTEEEARDAGHDLVVSSAPVSGVAGAALLRDHVSGTAQIVVDRRTRLLLGATFVGPDVGELVHAATVAITGRVPVHVLRHAVPSYPTSAEVWLRLLEELPVELRRPA
ncbi:dihydrolipoyl dehydrogenase family protein [Janibacter limosus]|uniref:NAD(P)/FAD-dependent oxidoreductase n=1 Tax=Janibacter limosus TaxID=53458 RepID=A0A4P6N014_9MICO|nr:NAD(P)/FAD-dependent oxidoreductase [Janibacter limosus]QBF47690.1 NAD(P)/FAD-dependent oxidoreductase [Janibacter limosus]